MKTIVLGSGCFWCGEAVYSEVVGVRSVVPGYAGGHAPNPTYEQVCTGETGHAEVIRVEYDPSVVSLTEILRIFFLTHDPTSLNKQGADVGTEYRSAIYYTGDEDKAVIDTFVHDAQATINDPIVTEIAPLDVFYEAESYHRNYFAEHPESAYCQVVIEPKLAKLRAYLRQ